MDRDILLDKAGRIERDAAPLHGPVWIGKPQRYVEIAPYQILDLEAAEFVAEDAAAFTPAEARLLEAERQALSARIISCARQLSRFAPDYTSSCKGEKS